MKSSFYRRVDCRLCGGRDLRLVFSLNPTPPANAFLNKPDLVNEEPVYPLDLFFCLGCKHVQLLDVVDPEVLFRDYIYVSGTSQSFVDHFDSYASTIISKYKVQPNSLILDIGSNDGTLLQKFKDRKMRVLGIDPATDIASVASDAGIDTWPLFFSPKVANEILEKIGHPEVVTANNVFAHSDELSSILSGIKMLLGPNSIFVFEVSYLLDVFEKNLFDTIYHEHLAYHSVGPLVKFFDDNGLQLIDVERVDTHGGSLRGVVQLFQGSRDISSEVAKLCELESELGLDVHDSFLEFGLRAKKNGFKLNKLLTKIRTGGGSIVGFGAPAKSTTLLHSYGIDGNILDYIVDDNPLKQGKYTPGYNIPIKPTEKIYSDFPDYLLVLAWNFADDIISKLRGQFNKPVKVVIPLPDLKVVYL